MLLRRLEYSNLWVWCSLLVVLSLTTTPLAGVASWLKLFLGVAAIFLAGCNITLLIQQVTGHNYPWPVAFTMSVLNALLIPPAILLGIYLLIGKISLTTIIPLYVLIVIAPFLHRYFWKKRSTKTIAEFEFPRSKLVSRLLGHPLAWALLTVLAVHLINILWYDFIPAPDAYSWLIAAERDLPQHQIDTTISEHRWASLAFLAIFYNLASDNLYLFFKYLAPLLMVVIVVPLWIIAEQLKSRLLQYVFLVSVLVSPTIILEMEIVRQQVIFLLYLFSLLGLLAYAVRAKDRLVFYLTGLYTLLGMAVHPSFVITSMAWIFTLVVIQWSWFWRHKVWGLLVLVLAHPWLERLTIYNMLYRIYLEGFSVIRNFFTLQWNLRFPAQYINSDGFNVGWAGLGGVMRYYGFYVGPVVIGSAVLVLGLVCFNQTARRYIVAFVRHREFVFLGSLSLFFLLIAEIAPRFGNVAYLPDRAWQYLAIISLFWLLPALYFIDEQWGHRRIQLTSLLLMSAIAVSVAGAFYVNYLGGFTVPAYELEAAQWLKRQASTETLVLSPTSKNVVRYHSGATYVFIQDWDFAEFNQKALGQYLAQAIKTITPTSASVLSVTAPPAEQVEQRVMKKWHNPYLREAALKIEAHSDSQVQAIGALYSIVVQGYLQPEMAERLQAQAQFLGSENQKLWNDVLAALVAVDTPSDDEGSGNTMSVTDDTGEVVGPRLSAYVYYAAPHPRNFFRERPYKQAIFESEAASEPPYNRYPDFFEEVYRNQDSTVVIWRILLTDRQAVELAKLKAQYEGAL